MRAAAAVLAASAVGLVVARRVRCSSKRLICAAVNATQDVLPVPQPRKVLAERHAHAWSSGAWVKTVWLHTRQVKHCIHASPPLHVLSGQGRALPDDCQCRQGRQPGHCAHSHQRCSCMRRAACRAAWCVPNDALLATVAETAIRLNIHAITCCPTRYCRDVELPLFQ